MNEEDFGLSKDVVESTAALSDKLNEKAQVEQVTALAEGLIEAFGGKEGFAEFSGDLNEMMKQLMPPDLVERQTVVEKRFAEIAAAGGKPEDHPELIEELAAIIADPRMMEIMKASMSGMEGEHGGQAPRHSGH